MNGLIINMIKQVLFITFVSLFCISCRNAKSDATPKDIVIENFLVLSVPSSLEFWEGKGVDSYVAYLSDHNGDTFLIEYGQKWVVNDLYDEAPDVFPLEKREWVTKSLGRPPTDQDALFSEFPVEDYKQRIFDRSYFLYDTIGPIISKIVQPKRIGNGVTGLYIPKLKNGKSFSIYAANLDSTKHQFALQMFRTIRYK